MKKIMIAHVGKQHSFRLTEAIKSQGWLMKYATTVYLKKFNWTGFVGKLLKGDNLNRVRSRRNPILNDYEVKQFCELMGIVNLLLIRIDKTERVYRKWANFTIKCFARKFARYTLKKNPDAIIMYDTNASICFEILEKKAPHIIRILDVSSASHAYMKMIFEKDMDNFPKFAKSLRESVDYFWNEKRLAELEKEIKLAHHFLVPSKFVQKSLEFHGVSPENIHLCPYGVDINKFTDEHIEDPHGKLRFVYVGALTQRKGIGYLLEAFSIYSSDEISLTLVGNYDNSKGLFDEYYDKYHFTGFVTHDKVSEILSHSDIMIFPSLSDAYSLAVLEALGSGIPVICTENTGASDIIKDKYNGFVISTGNIEKIREKVDWFLKHKEELPLMRKNARNTAIKCTWNTYNKRIEDIMKSIFEES